MRAIWYARTSGASGWVLGRRRWVSETTTAVSSCPGTLRPPPIPPSSPKYTTFSICIRRVDEILTALARRGRTSVFVAWAGMGKCASIFCINAVTCVGLSIILPHVESCTHKEAPNARGEPRPRAGARHERRLLGVGSSALFGPAVPPRSGLPRPPWSRGPSSYGTPQGTRATPPPTPVGDTLTQA